MRSIFIPLFYKDSLWTNRRTRKILHFFRKQERDFNLENEYFKIYVDYRRREEGFYTMFVCSMINGEQIFHMVSRKGYAYVEMTEQNYNYMKIKDYSPFIHMLEEEKNNIELKVLEKEMTLTSKYSLQKEKYLNALKK